MSGAAPVGGRNFVVRVTERGPRGGLRDAWEMGCRQVVLPVLRVEPTTQSVIGKVRRPTLERADQPDVEPRTDELLVLRRGHTGSTELSDWWTQERTVARRIGHDVEVTALDDAGRAVTTWRFTGCHLVTLQYSPLDAIDSDVLMETAEVAFDDVTQRSHR